MLDSVRFTTIAIAAAVVVSLLVPRPILAQRRVKVRDTQELRAALQEARPGTTILLEAGVYRGGISAAGLAGRPGKPIVIAAADPKRPPVVKGGGSGLHLVDPAFVELRGLVLEGAKGNGLNIDDGGSYETPAHDILLTGLVVRDVGPSGNRDGIKLSGVDRLRIDACTVLRWGRGGSGIDLVGCHGAVIQDCVFRHAPGRGANAVQTKGGSRDIVIRKCRFEHAGQRAVNLGGSTGLPYLRPEPQGYEAKNITVEGCTFVGSGAPIAFVGVDGATVRFNTIYRPRRWVLRILQETTREDFVPCRNGRFTDNLIAFRMSEVARHVNVGPKTAPETFAFARNFWFCLDRPQRSKPTLPARETAGVYGKDPQFRDADKGDLRVSRKSPARRRGAHALPTSSR